MGGDPGQGAREIWEPPSEERALWKANPFALPREQEFFKACNYRAAEREAASGSHAAGTAARVGVLAGSEACAELPGCLWGAPGTPSRLQGNPSGRRCVFGNSAAANHPTRQESSGIGLAPVQDFCLMAIFLPLSFLSSAKFLLILSESILRILRQLETLPKARRGKPITLLQKQLVQPGLCNPKTRLRRE